MQPLLAFIGGDQERFTEQEHAYYAGEEITKSAVLVWDGYEARSFSLTWTWMKGDEVLAQEEKTLTLNPGETRMEPIALHVPMEVAGREDTVLKLAVRGEPGGPVLQEDELALSLWPSLEDKPAWKNQSRWAVYDPAGKSLPWMGSLGVNAVRVDGPESLQNVQADVLVMGRESLGSGELPFTETDIVDGLWVLVLEQQPKAWKSLGLRMQDIVTRYVFPRDRESMVYAGLEDEDLINWRGSPDLLPPTSEGMEPWPNTRSPHWGNEGAVASVVLETPQRGAFTPLADAEFDLAYSPLLEWRHGKGGVLFSTFDFTGRVGVDPTATRLASNILKALDSAYPSDQARQLAYLGDKADREYVKGLGFSVRRIQPGEVIGLDTGRTLLVLGAGALDTTGVQVSSWVSQGGIALVLPQPRDAFSEANLPFVLKTHDVSLSKVSPGNDALILRGIGPQTLHWRMPVTQAAFEPDSLPHSAVFLLDGLLAEIPEGKGKWVFSQLDWKPFEDGSWTLEKTRWNTMKFYRQLCTNLGAVSDAARVQTLLDPQVSSPMENISAWQVLNSVYSAKPTEPGILEGLAITMPVESISGEQLTEDGTTSAASAPKDQESTAAGIMIGKGEANLMRADNKGKWMRMEPRPDGFVHLDWISTPAMGKIGYARTYIYSGQAREAVFSMGADYWMVFRVNGEAIIDNTQKERMRHAPSSSEYQVTAPLKKGWNLLEVKVGSGVSGFGFWCAVSDPGDLEVVASLTQPDTQPETRGGKLLPEPDLRRETIFYQRAFTPEDDPYSLVPW
jgi:beta-galactosidase